MTRPARGFTLVELLIVIVVLGILMSIASASWIAYVGSSNDKAREMDIKQWASTFDLYKSRFTVWPGTPASSGSTIICLGTFPSTTSDPNYSNGRCGQYTGAATVYRTASGTEWNTVKAAVESVSNWPQNGGPVTKKIAAGPIVYLIRSGSSTVTVKAAFVGYFEGSCPSDMVTVPSLTASDYSALRTFAALPASSGITACAITDEMRFNPL